MSKQRSRDSELRKRLGEFHRQRAKQLRRHEERLACGANGQEVQVRRELANKLRELRGPERVHELAPAGIVWQDDHWDGRILATGRKFESNAVQSVKGQANQCHINCAVLYWLRHPQYRIATGYVFQSGLWGRHSWLMDGEAIVETSSKRDVYFGVVLEGIDSTNFLINQYLSLFQGFGFDVEAHPVTRQVILTPPGA